MIALIRAVRAWSLLVAGLLFVTQAANAQDDLSDQPGAEPTEPVSGGMSFDLNSVLVATFEASQPFLDTEAERVRHLVEDALAQGYVVVKMDEVPPFTDYSADIYLRSCPQGQYIGCVFVVGGRAQTDWTIGGKVTAVEGGYQVFLSFIRVGEAKLKLEFDVVLDGSNDAEFQEGVIKTMDALVNDNVKDLDLRDDPEAARAQAAEAAKREQMSRDFSSGNEFQQDDQRGDVGVDAYVDGERDRGAARDRSSEEDLEEDSSPAPRESGHVTSRDLSDMQERGGMTPWERAGLTKGQYRLYRNSNIKLRDFKAKLQGRKGEILIGVGMNVSSGSWGQYHETFFVQDGAANTQNVKPSDIVAQVGTLYTKKALALGGVFDVGVGLAPWLELRVFAGLHSAPFQYRFDKQTLAGDTVVAGDLKDPDSRSVTTMHVGLKLNFVPMPAYPARPTFALGVSYWQGTALSKLVQVPTYLAASQFKPLATLYVDAQPGVEVSAGKFVAIYARADIDIPVFDFGRTITVASKNTDALTRFPDPATAPSFGIGGSLGLTMRIRVAGDR